MKIGIIGLGLIGGSLFKSLKKDFDVIAVSKSQNDENIVKTYDALKDRDLVFVCTPMNKTLTVLDDLENVLTSRTVVTDVCSLKEFVCKKTRKYKFIPSHPMAGTENKGFENSFEGLFNGASWVIISENGNIPEGAEDLLEIIEYLKAKPVFTTAKEHDQAVALISHMPMVIAQALVNTAKDNALAMKIAASGFRDMTRLALSNEEMAEDMVYMNSKNIEQAILKLYKSVGDLTNGDYKNNILALKKIRAKMF